MILPFYASWLYNNERMSKNRKYNNINAQIEFISININFNEQKLGIKHRIIDVEEFENRKYKTYNINLTATTSSSSSIH